MAFSASLASRMYLSRTRLSQMRRGGAPRTGRPRGNSRKDSISSGVQSRKESRAADEVDCRRRRAGLDSRFTHPAAQPPVSPPHPDLGSAQALPPLSFNPAAACTPHPPSYRHPLLPAKLQSRCDSGVPSRRSGLWLPDPGV